MSPALSGGFPAVGDWRQRCVSEALAGTPASERASPVSEAVARNERQGFLNDKLTVSALLIRLYSRYKSGGARCKYTNYGFWVAIAKEAPLT